MTLPELQLRVADLARQCPDIQALQEAARVLAQAQGARFGTSADTGQLAGSGEGSMSREEFLRRLRGA